MSGQPQHGYYFLTTNNNIISNIIYTDTLNPRTRRCGLVELNVSYLDATGVEGSGAGRKQDGQEEAHAPWKMKDGH
jgi:hypothetical protein